MKMDIWIKDKSKLSEQNSYTYEIFTESKNEAMAWIWREKIPFENHKEAVELVLLLLLLFCLLGRSV